MANYGWSQNILIGQELSHGVPVSPSTNIGIVLDGLVREGSDVSRRFGIESKVVTGQCYTDTSCGASCTILLSSVSILDSVFRDSMGELPSYTLDCGLLSSGVRRRLVGCKVDQLTMRLSNEAPVEVNLNFKGLYVVDGSGSAVAPFSGPLYVPQNITIWYAGGLMDDITELELSIKSNLITKFLASRQSANVRGCSRIDAGKQEIEVVIHGGDRLPVEVRSLLPKSQAIDIELYLKDLCSEDSFSLYLHNCMQKEITESMSPNTMIEYATPLTVGSMEYYAYGGG